MLRILWCGFGLGFTVLTVVLVTLFVPILPPLVIWHDPMGLLALFLVGGLLTGLVVYPTFAYAAYIRSLKSITSPYYWIGVGGLVALFVNLMLTVIFAPYTNFITLNSSIMGGFAGGFVYSLFHSKETLFMMVKDIERLFKRTIVIVRAYIAKPTLNTVSA